MKSLLRVDSCTLGPKDRLIAGSSAGIISQSLIYPLEVSVYTVTELSWIHWTFSDSSVFFITLV